MNRLKHITLTLALILSTLTLGAQTDNYFLHTVTKGQGLYSISRMYGVTEADIIALNPGSEVVIKAGQQLRIPQKQQQPVPCSGPFPPLSFLPYPSFFRKPLQACIFLTPSPPPALLKNHLPKEAGSACLKL